MSYKIALLIPHKISSLCRCNITDHFDFDAFRKRIDACGPVRTFTMTYRWNRKRPILSNTKTVTINPAQTMTNSRLRTAMTNIQSLLLDRAGAAEYPRSSS